MVECRSFQELPEALPFSALHASLMQDGRLSLLKGSQWCPVHLGLLAPEQIHACINRALWGFLQTCMLLIAPAATFCHEGVHAASAGRNQNPAHGANAFRLHKECCILGSDSDGLDLFECHMAVSMSWVCFLLAPTLS